jgi:F-type H+-transporting ATPase subunit delta
MAEKTTIARPYAKAAFQEAQGDKDLPRWSEALRAAATAVRDPRTSCSAVPASAARIWRSS